MGQLLVTGGASNNPAILKVFADVFQRPVRVMQVAEGAAFGAAVRALHAHRGHETSPEDIIGKLLDNSQVQAEPSAHAAAAYSATSRAYAALEAKARAERGREL